MGIHAQPNCSASRFRLQPHLLKSAISALNSYGHLRTGQEISSQLDQQLSRAGYDDGAKFPSPKQCPPVNGLLDSIGNHKLCTSD